MGALAYTGLVLFLRAGGKRTLSKMNAFDLVVTVALGPTLATVLLTKGVALLEGLVGFAVLILLPFTVSRLSVRFATVRRVARQGSACRRTTRGGTRTNGRPGASSLPSAAAV